MQFVKIDDFAALAEAALHQETGEGFFGFVGRREVNVPEIGGQVEKVNGVEETVWLLVNFCDDAGPRALPEVAFVMAAEVELLSGGDSFAEAEDAAVAADKQSLNRLGNGGAGAGDPRCLHGHAEAHAVTLP